MGFREEQSQEETVHRLDTFQVPWAQFLKCPFTCPFTACPPEVGMEPTFRDLSASR